MLSQADVIKSAQAELQASQALLQSVKQNQLITRLRIQEGRRSVRISRILLVHLENRFNHAEKALVTERSQV